MVKIKVPFRELVRGCDEEGGEENGRWWGRVGGRV